MIGGLITTLTTTAHKVTLLEVLTTAILGRRTLIAFLGPWTTAILGLWTLSAFLGPWALTAILGPPLFLDFEP